jgi:hypothetical protein
MAAKSKAISDTLYLQRIGQRWYARIPVPSKLRGALGPYIRKALDTSDINEARKRRWDFLPIAKGQIEKAQRQLGLSPTKPAAGARERSYAPSALGSLTSALSGSSPSTARKCTTRTLTL